ncbi:MAG: hypothetical protein ACPF9W_09110, partial [Nocardioides sp.]
MSLPRTLSADRRPSAIRRALAALAATALLAPAAAVALAAPAAAQDGKDRIARLAGAGSASAGLVMSDNIEQVGENPSQLAISGMLRADEDETRLADAAARLDRIADEGEEGWTA